MRIVYQRYVWTVLLFVFGSNVFGQKINISAVQKQNLNVLSQSLNTQRSLNYQKAVDLAVKNGWPVYTKKADGTIIALQGVDALGFPLYLTTYNNVIAAATTRTNTVQPGGTLGLNLTGASAYMGNKLAIWDGGAVYASHQEFAGKAITVKDGTTSIVDHSTHVAGTMIAKGVYPPAKGMAYGAATLQSYDFNNDATEMAAAASNLLISNHSYGYLAGWNYNDSQTRWEWYGLPGDTVDYKFGFYDANTQAYDQIAYNAPQYLIVEAAGNNRGETGPAVGQSYYGYNSRTDFTLVNKGARPAYISSNDGYDIISTTATAKNILTVGAVNPLPYGVPGSSAITAASFTSWGATDDGRIKPDICGDGVNVLSTGVTAPDAYLTLSGTSMATPNVSASLYLLQEYYAQKNSGNFMRSATLKGLACHTATDAGNPGPDYIYGWGLLDMSKAAQAITDNGTKSLIAEKTLSQGQTQTYNVVASGNGALSATISWTDPAGAPTASGVINNRTPKLVNDLDIRISDGTNTYQPYILDYKNPSANATTGDNIRDNIEQVFIANATPGKSYTITVTHKGTLFAGFQNYSLIATGVGGSAYCASLPLSSADSRIDNVTISNINNSPAPGCTTYSNYTNFTGILEQGKTYPLTLTLGTCGSNFNKIAKVYIDFNGNGSFTDPGELVATTGVLVNTGTYTTNVTVPLNVSPDTYSLMRVVLVETNDPTAISPCGTYPKGETQDYRVQFTRTSVDVGITAINSPSVSGVCPGANSQISVHLKNFGTAPVSNIPVTVTLTSASAPTVTINENYTGTLNPLDEVDFLLKGSFNPVAGATYTITATTNLSTDVIAVNNSATSTAVISQSPVPLNLFAYFCNDLNLYNLSGNGDGTLFWYKNAGDALPFAYGSPVITAQTPVNNTYYAGLNDFSGYVGPATKTAFGSSGYNQFTPGINVNTKVPAIIDNARLYIGSAGQITFTVTGSNGETVSSTTLNVTPTTSKAVSPTVDDPADPGQIYNLNLAFPTAGNYTINISYANGATIYRSNNGVSGYPFTLNGIFSITGNGATNGTDTTYYKNFYYYLYNIHVKSLGCPSVTRAAVPVTKPVITQTGLVLNSNFSSGNQWYLNGAPIKGATGQTYTPLQSGTYKLYVTIAGGCTSISDDYIFIFPATGNDNGAQEISLGVFPVPTSTSLNVSFIVKAASPATISIVSTAGKIVYTETDQVATGGFSKVLDVSRLAGGVYFLKVKVGDQTYHRKVTITR
jgi:hypothetical protein